MTRPAQQKADDEHARDLRDWKFKASRLVPRGCTVTQVGASGFWFQRPGKAAAEFMAWPVSTTTDNRYGRVER